MTEPLESSGVGPGAHVCAIYETDEERHALLATYVRDGLRLRQRVGCLADERLGALIVGCLAEEGIDARAFVASGQLVMRDSADAFLRGGIFDSDRAIALLEVEAERAAAEGWEALRIVTEMTGAFLAAAGGQSLVEYESRASDVLPTRGAVAICLYDLRRVDPRTLLELLEAHPLVGVGTEVFENPWFLPQAERSSPQADQHRLGRWIEAMRRAKEEQRRMRREAEEAIREANSSLQLAQESRLALLSMLEDQKRTEEALRRREAQLSTALRLARAGHWEYDVATDTFTFSDNFYRIFRTTATEVGGYTLSSEEYARRFCHPEDRQVVAREVEAALTTQDPEYCRELEHRILYADGTVGHMAVLIRVVKDARGHTIKTYGVNQDITHRKRIEEALRRTLADKEVLLREVHHRVKNNLMAIISLLDLKRGAFKDERVDEALRQLQEQARTMALVYEQLYESESLAQVDMQDYLERLAANLLLAFRGDRSVSMRVSAHGVTLDVERATPCGLIVNELVTNALKHAFPDPARPGLVEVRLGVEGSTGELVVRDDGVGMGQLTHAHEASGLRLVRLWATHQLGGTMEVRARKGTEVVVRFGLS